MQVDRHPKRRDDEAEYEALAALYFERFDELVPQPVQVSLAAVSEQMRLALSLNRPIPADHDWYAYLPPDAVA